MQVRTTLSEQLMKVQEEVRKNPSAAKYRIHLFQLYAQAGKWDKSLSQLQMAAKLDSSNNLIAHVYRFAINAELYREKVFFGSCTPNIFGERFPWIDYLVDALEEEKNKNFDKVIYLRNKCFDEADANPGMINDIEFEWLSDADSRIGPMLECFLNNGYYWIPLQIISEIKIENPQDLRDLVWIPADLKLKEGTNYKIFIPARYPLQNSEINDDHLQSKITTWNYINDNLATGVGVKVFLTDSDQFSALDVRAIKFL